MQHESIEAAREYLAGQGAFAFRPIPKSLGFVRVYRHAPHYPGMFGEQLIYQGSADAERGTWQTTGAWMLCETMA